MKIKNTFNNHLLSLIWLLFLILPNNLVFYLFVPVGYILLYDRNKKSIKSVFYYAIIFISLMIVSFIINANESYIDFNSILRVIVLILMFFMFSRLKGDKILAPYIYIAIFFIIGSQFAGILNLGFFNSLIDNFYVNEEGNSAIEKASTFNMEYFGMQRLSGIYFNPNNYASYIQLVLAVLLCEISQFSKRNIFILIALIIISIVATGSRTSFIVLVALLLYYLYSSKTITKKNAIVISLLIIFSFLVFSFFINFGDLRMFAVNEGLDDSLGAKIRLLSRYMNANPPLIKLLFGNFSGDAMYKFTNSTFTGTDFEIGNLIVYYGFLFFIALFSFYIFLFKKILPKYRVIFIILLWMFSNSILISYRMSSVWIIVLSLYYQKSIKEKSIQKTNNLFHEK